MRARASGLRINLYKAEQLTRTEQRGYPLFTGARPLKARTFSPPNRKSLRILIDNVGVNDIGVYNLFT